MNQSHTQANTDTHTHANIHTHIHTHTHTETKKVLDRLSRAIGHRKRSKRWWRRGGTALRY